VSEAAGEDYAIFPTVEPYLRRRTVDRPVQGA
jgi:hypothetical protein